MERQWARWVGAVGLAAVVVVATPSTALASGPLVTDGHDGYSFRLPSGWQQIQLTESRVKTILNEATKIDPKLKAALTSDLQSAVSSHEFKVYAIGPLSGSFLPNANVIVTPGDGAPTGQSFVSQAASVVHQELGSAGAKGLTTRPGTLDKMPVLTATYTLPEKIFTAYGIQVYASRNGQIVNLTVTAGSPAVVRSAENEITGSWRWH